MIWGALRHPRVLPLLGVIMNGFQLVMVSEWMPNGSIKNGLYEGVPLMAGSSSPDHNFVLLISFITKGYSVHLHYKPAGFPSKSCAKGVF